MPVTKDPRYIQALLFLWLNRFYDRVVKATPKEAELRAHLAERLDAGAGWYRAAKNS